MLEPAPWQHRALWPPHTTHVADARHFVDNRLREHGLARESEAVLVVVSELATNAILYAGGPFTVSLQHTNDTLTVSVRDGSLAPLVQHAPPESFDVRGRGLQIVERLSSSWGVTPHHDGKSVRARFD